MQYAFERIALAGDFGQVEPGREMRALAGQNHGAHVFRQTVEEGLDPQHGDVVERVALLGAGEAQVCDAAVAGGSEGRGQFDANRLFITLGRHRSS